MSLAQDSRCQSEPLKRPLSSGLIPPLGASLAKSHLATTPLPLQMPKLEPKDSFGFKVTAQSLVAQSSSIIQQLEQAKTCLEAFNNRHKQQLAEVKQKMVALLNELQDKTNVLQLEVKNEEGQVDVEIRMKKGAVSIYHEYMQNQLDSFKGYLDFLFKSFKNLPENQACIHYFSSTHKPPKDYSPHFPTTLIANLPHDVPYDTLLAHLDNDYLVMASKALSCTDLVQYSGEKVRVVQRHQGEVTLVVQHDTRLILDYAVYAIYQEMQLVQQFNRSEEIHCYCAFDPSTLLVGLNSNNVAIFVWNLGQYQEAKLVKLNNPIHYHQVIQLVKVNHKQLVAFVGKAKCNIKLIELDTSAYIITEVAKIATYSTEVISVHPAGSKILVKSTKKVLQIDLQTLAGYEKVFRMREPTTNLLVFPFYDSIYFPYVIADNNRIYDTKLKECVGKLTGVDDSARTLGFIKGTTMVLVSTEQALMIWNVDVL